MGSNQCQICSMVTMTNTFYGQSQHSGRSCSGCTILYHVFRSESIFFILILPSCHLPEQHRDGCRRQEPQLRYHERDVLDGREVVAKIQQL